LSRPTDELKQTKQPSRPPRLPNDNKFPSIRSKIHSSLSCIVYRRQAFKAAFLDGGDAITSFSGPKWLNKGPKWM